MSTTIPVTVIKETTKTALSEAFDTVIGMYLDKGDSLWETLENVTAEQASIPIAPGSNSIASQLSHMTYYFDIMAMYLRGETPQDVDWDSAWQKGAVDEDEWKDIRRALAERQAELYTLIDNTPDESFTDPDVFGGTYAIVAHTAFHLGQIRHALAAQGVSKETE